MLSASNGRCQFLLKKEGKLWAATLSDSRGLDGRKQLLNYSKIYFGWAQYGICWENMSRTKILEVVPKAKFVGVVTSYDNLFDKLCYKYTLEVDGLQYELNGGPHQPDGDEASLPETWGTKHFRRAIEALRSVD